MACHIDFRRLDEGLGGAKRKRAEAEAKSEADMDLDLDPQPAAKRQALTSASNPSRPTYDGVIAGKVSGRSWKQVRTQRSAAMRVSRRTPSLEVRKREKELKRAFKERKDELKEEIRKNKIEKRAKKEEREKKKEENILRTGSRLQVISNPKTLKKIAKSKKDKKKLKVVSDDVISARNGGKGKK